MESFAERVKNRRTALGLTQHDVAKISGLKQSDVSKIEHGRVNETTKVLGLARALRCDPDWLATGKGHLLPTPKTQVAVAQDSDAPPLYRSLELNQALDLIETHLTQLDMAGRERLAPLFESFARSPGAVIKADISALLACADPNKSRTAQAALLQKTG